MSKVKSHHIIHALSKKHREDIFFSEVKTGSTWRSLELLRIDALAIKKSWAKPCISGYEVKVSRQDFLRDEKWTGYLPYNHKFYFVCPTGLIKPEELPDEIGLIYYNHEKGTLYTKRAAKYRTVEIPPDMFYYLLISRTESDRHPFFSDKREYFESYVADKMETQMLGRLVQTKLVKETAELASKNRKLERQLEQAEEDVKLFGELKEYLRQYDIYFGRRSNWKENLAGLLESGINENMRMTVGMILRSANELDKMLQPKEAQEEVSAHAGS